MRILRSLGLCTALLGAASTAWATDRRVPEDYSTIQAAVDACASGDVVVCGPGTYTEAVTATKSNFTITTTSYRAVWDGKTGTDAVTCLDVSGDAVVVTGFDFKNGVDHVKLRGADCKVKNCTSKYAGRTFCDLEGARPVVDTCTVDYPKGPGIRVKGDYHQVLYCKVRDCDDVGFRCEGNNGRSRNCRADRNKKGGFHCKGREYDKKYCEAYDCDDFGFKLEFDASVVVSNYAENCGGTDGAGFLTVGSDNTFRYCDTWACKPHGHHVKGHRNWHDDNWSDYCDEDGFRYEGDDNDCDYGRSRNNGRDGYNFRGDRNDFYDCDGSYNDDDGYDCEGGTDNRMRYCDSRSNDGAGCENGGSSTDLYGCVLLYNSVDIGLDGTLGASFGSLSLNVFGSGSILTVLQIGLGL